MVSRAMVQYDDDGTAGASKFVDSLVGEKEAEDLADAVARYRKRTAAIHRTDSLGRSQQLFPEFEPATNLKERDFSESHFEFSREYRWPMRFFEDHQIAMAEIFASIRPKSEQTQKLLRMQMRSETRHLLKLYFWRKIFPEQFYKLKRILFYRIPHSEKSRSHNKQFLTLRRERKN